MPRCALPSTSSSNHDSWKMKRCEGDSGQSWNVHVLTYWHTPGWLHTPPTVMPTACAGMLDSAAVLQPHALMWGTGAGCWDRSAHVKYANE